MALLREKVVPWSDYCKKLYHFSETCYFLHPHLRSLGGGGRRSRCASSNRDIGIDIHCNYHYVASEEIVEPSFFSVPLATSELYNFRKFMSQLNTHLSANSANSVHACISYHFVFNSCPTSWIIDSWASTQMTENSSLLQLYHDETDNIRITNGASVLVQG